MATIREIHRRIKAIKSTQKITRAMQMVAAAKLRRAQENILKARPYAVELETIAVPNATCIRCSWIVPGMARCCWWW